MKKNFTQQLLQHANDAPDKEIIYIRVDQKYHAIRYRDLIQGAARYQHYLAEHGIGKGDVVIIILQHGIELIYAYFGCVLNGSIPSIMPYLTEKLIPEKYKQDLEALFGITKPKGVITYNNFSDEIEFLRNKPENDSVLILVDNVSKDSIIVDKKSEEFPGWACDEKDIALLQHSSGTTGLQKGVALSHQAIFNQLISYSNALEINDADVVVSWLPLYHDMGLIAGFLMPIFLGIPLAFMSPFAWVRAPHLLMQAISNYKGTLCWLPNFAYNFCAKKIRDRNMNGVDLSSLRAVVNCSEPMRKNSHDMFIKAFEQYGLRSSAIATSYAMAENVFAVTQGGIKEAVNNDVVKLVPFQEEKKAVLFDGEGQLLTMVSAGKPIDGTEVRIADKDGGFLPERNIGEVVLRSNCMLSGYYKRADVTKKAFLNDEWFLTGDFGYMADGELYITGRKKDLIIVGGKNIYPKDIETIVMGVEGVYPGRVVAFGIFNEQKGTEDVVVIAEIDDIYLDKMQEIATLIRSIVTRESAIALRQVLTVERKWLIKTSSGKIARALNKEKYLKEFNQGK